MKSIFDMTLRIIAGIFIAFLLSFPVFGVIQWLGPDTATPYDTYKEFLSVNWVYINKYGDWVIVIILTIFFVRYANNYYSAAEQIRLNRLYAEFKRWRRTPYISPYLFYSLVSPRSSYSNDFRDRVLNDYYKNCINLFRERVYIDGSFSQIDPEKRPSWIRIAGASHILPIIFCATIIFCFFILLLKTKPIALWFTGWDKFAIPILAFICAWAGQLLFAAYYIGGFKDIQEDMNDYFQGIEPRIPWRETFPDRPKGKVILLAWQYETNDRKIKYHDYLKQIHGFSPPSTECPAIAQFPYPSDQIPEWADDMEREVYQFTEQWKEDKITHQVKLIGKTKGKVVLLNRKKNW